MIEWISFFLVMIVIIILVVFIVFYANGRIDVGPTGPQGRQGVMGIQGPTGARGSGNGNNSTSSLITFNSGANLIDGGFLFFGSQSFLEEFSQIVISQPSVLSNLIVSYSTLYLPGDYEFVVRVNNHDSALRVRPTGPSGINTTARISVITGDKVSIQFNNFSGGTPVTNALATFSITS